MTDTHITSTHITRSIEDSIRCLLDEASGYDSDTPGVPELLALAKRRRTRCVPVDVFDDAWQYRVTFCGQVECIDTDLAESVIVMARHNRDTRARKIERVIDHIDDYDQAEVEAWFDPAMTELAHYDRLIAEMTKELAEHTSSD